METYLPKFEKWNFLHLYPQPFWHDEAYIVGNRKGLERLRDALNKALEDEGDVDVSVNVMANDGEGYSVHVVKVNDGEKINMLAVPYTDEISKERDAEALYPHALKLSEKCVAYPEDMKRRPGDGEENKKD